jgi:outer membrane protein TolC
MIVPIRHRMQTLRPAVIAGLLLVSPLALRAQGGDTLRLEIGEAVARALNSSDESRIADALVDLADAQVTTARATGLPQLRLNSGYTQVVKNARADIVGSLFRQNYNYSTNLNVQQALFQGGRILAASQAATRLERATLAVREETRATLAVEAQRVYLNAAFTARIAEIQRTNLELADARVAQAEQLERAGRASRYDVLRARVERANLEPIALQAESARALAELDLRRFLDLPLDAPLVLATTLDPVRIRELAAAAVADTSRPVTRASVRAAEATASARDAGIRVARAELLPTINAAFNFGYLALPAFNGFPSEIEQPNGWYPDRNFQLQMSWPVFQGMRVKGNIDLAQAQAQLADLEVRRAREQASIEVSSARAELERARAVSNARESTVREAEEAFELATLRFNRGIGTQLEVSDAQLALLTARSTDARATFDLFLAVAEHARARGEPIPLPSGERIAVRPPR